ncbi:hypothetical protein GCM10009551_083830 [Nocardiopsis tropica]
MGMRRIGIGAASAALALVLLACGVLWLSTVRETPLTRHLPAELRPRVFPVVQTDGLAPERVRIVDNLRREFAQNRPGTDFSEGVVEPWCADFVSTVLRDSGLAVRNPNSGTWRIPGVYTLTEYFQREGRFRPAGYVPAVGDVVLYAPEHRFGQPTNFVVAVADGVVTTVGGNQPGGITALTFDHADTAGVVGYGIPVR